MHTIPTQANIAYTQQFTQKKHTRVRAAGTYIHKTLIIDIHTIIFQLYFYRKPIMDTLEVCHRKQTRKEYSDMRRRKVDGIVLVAEVRKVRRNCESRREKC